MDINTYLQMLETLAQKLIDLPEGENRETEFVTYQERLRVFLEEAPPFNEHEQEQIKIALKDLSQRLQDKMNALKTQLKEIEGDLKRNKNHLKGAMAYGGGRIF